MAEIPSLDHGCIGEPSATPAAHKPLGIERLGIERIIAEHADVLYRYASRLTGNSADAEDLTQQTLLIAHAKIDQLHDEQCARAWLMTVLRRTYCRLYKRRRFENQNMVSLDVETLAAEDVSPDWEIDRQRLQVAIDQLPDKYKIVLLSFYFENLSYRQLSEQLRLPIGTVMSRLARAKAQLRGLLFADELETSGVHAPHAPRQGGT
jgi:RNA polymerase sigma-70 factor, ECF subfamily